MIATGPLPGYILWLHSAVVVAYTSWNDSYRTIVWLHSLVTFYSSSGIYTMKL